ncbi:hypothetical protein HPP92_020798 [Vanilla planifolia]|uniref:ACT domain-containing protein ACR n=1 Tax=Vanilla planifolia TaxID=51239 RepID=A0A835PXY5_VANPL|nr:hypothetical protein HPP92_020798 [Vanilla planifolia]
MATGSWMSSTSPIGTATSSPMRLSYLTSSSLCAVLMTLPPYRPAASESLTTLELTGADRPGLLSEVFAVLADLQYSVAQAKLWTYKGRVAALIFVEEESGAPVEELDKIRCIKARLRNVVSVSLSSADPGRTEIDRRLHQMLLSDQELDHSATVSHGGDSSVSIQNWTERGYSIVSVQCRDRPKLLFDTVCALTDLNYVIFHGKIDTNDDLACQEFYIRRADGSLIGSESERQTLIQCLQAAIDRRASEGLRLELHAPDRRRELLAEATRTFRENGLSVTMAEVSRKGDTASNVFYVTDAAGRPANVKTIDAVIEKIGAGNVRVCEDPIQGTGRNRPGWGGFVGRRLPEQLGQTKSVQLRPDKISVPHYQLYDSMRKILLYYIL